MTFERAAEVSFDGIDLDPITDLRIQFSVEKHDGIQLNRAEIIIFNLSENVRNTLARPHHLDRPIADPVITVILKAGYKGQEITMFAGDLVVATNERDGPDWKTVMTLFSGYSAISRGWTEISLDTKTDAKVVADRLLSPLGIDAVYTEEAQERLQGESVASYSSSGLSFRTAHDFLTRFNLAFTIEEDGSGLVYVDDRARDPNTEKTKQNNFTPKTGLIGTPKITNFGVSIRSLLRPDIKLMQKIFVESETITSTLRGGGGQLTNEYHAINIAHFGDTRGEDWFTEIEGVYSKLVRDDYA